MLYDNDCKVYWQVCIVSTGFKALRFKPKTLNPGPGMVIYWFGFIDELKWDHLDVLLHRLVPWQEWSVLLTNNGKSAIEEITCCASGAQHCANSCWTCQPTESFCGAICMLINSLFVVMYLVLGHVFPLYKSKCLQSCACWSIICWFQFVEWKCGTGHL